MNAEEVELLAREAARHSVSLVALGAGTAPESGAGKQGIAVRFDLMRRTRLPDGEEVRASVPLWHLAPEALARESFRPEHVALQGTVGRSAEVLLIAIGEPGEERAW